MIVQELSSFGGGLRSPSALVFYFFHCHVLKLCKFFVSLNLCVYFTWKSDFFLFLYRVPYVTGQDFQGTQTHSLSVHRPTHNTPAELQKRKS